MVIGNLREHQISTLMDHVMRLDKSHGGDSVALGRIRSIVANELLNKDLMDVTITALGRLEQESAARRLLDIVDYCHSHFYFEDRVLSAILVPVSVRLTALDREICAISKGDRDSLRDLAIAMTESTGATKIFFDTRFYEGRAIHLMPSRKLRDYLLQLEQGVFYPANGPQETSIFSEVDGKYRLVYFLGVEVTDLNKTRRLDDWPNQTASRSWYDYPSCAVECADEILFNAHVQAEAQSHGMHYFTRGLQQGERGHRSMRIAESLSMLGSQGKGVHLYCTRTLDEIQARTLAVGPQLSLELRWDLLQGESLWSFQQDLIRIAAEPLPDLDPASVIALEPDEYLAIARKHWVPVFPRLGKLFNYPAT